MDDVRQVTGPLCVEEVIGLEGLRRRAPEWQRLVAEATDPDFFQSWEWVESWLEAFADPGSVVTLFVRAGARLVAAVPVLSELHRCATKGPAFSLPANRQTPRSALLHAGPPEGILGAVFDHLRRSAGQPTVLAVPSCPVGSPLFRGLREAAATLGLGVVARPMRRSPRLTIRGDWRTYLEARTSHVRTEWRRKRRRLEAAGRTRFEVVTSGDVARAIQQVLEIERHCWKEAPGTSLTAEGAGGFYARLADRCAGRGWLRLHLLHVDDRPVAYVFGIAYRGEWLALKSSYDARLRALSPGIVLMLSALEQAFADGMSGFDLLGDTARWKAEVADGATEVHDVCLFSRGIVSCEFCRVLDVHVRPLVKRRFPKLVELGKRLSPRRLSGASQPRSRPRRES